MNNRTRPEPIDVNPCDYCVEWVLLLMSFIMPIFVCDRYHDPDLFERSGNLMLFFAVAAEFVHLNRLTKKHINNACRVKDGDTPKDISSSARSVGWVVFVLALAGTIISGYGEKLYFYFKPSGLG